MSRKSTNLPGSAGAILVAEDDADIGASLEMILGAEGYEVTVCGDGLEALERSKESAFDLVLTDFRMPGMGGLDLLKHLREAHPLRPVILMTAHGNTELAIEATKRGAYDYLLKPFDIDELIDVVAQAMKAGKTMRQRVRMGESSTTGEPSLLGSSRPMQNVYKEIGRIAPADVTVLILGETGSGKELVARAIYQHSQRNEKPFVAVNCGAIPENLLESELFGHVRGAFTGATADRIGRFEQAHGGTLFLDEIGDLPMPVQVKLLRVIQERLVQPLGSNREIPVDVRIIAATHQPLPALIKAKRFREDLYYRINSAIITLPALRDREGDLEELVRHFISEASAEYQLPSPAFSKSVITQLRRHDWPGNVRELRNVVRQIVLRSRGYAVSTELVRAILIGGGDEVHLPVGEENDFDLAIEAPVRREVVAARDSGKGQVHRDLVSQLERRIMKTALDLAEDHLGKVSDWLGISRVTLRKKMAEHGLGKGGESPLRHDED